MILGIDCSEGLGLVFFDKKKIFYKYLNLKINNSSEILISKIEDSLKRINKNYQNLSKIIVINGPGSFTGIRCSITFAKMIQISLKIPIYGFTKFELANFYFSKISKEKKTKKRIFLHHEKIFFSHAVFETHRLVSGPKIININQYNFDNCKKDIIISDTKLINKYVKNRIINKNSNKECLFDYNLADLKDLEEKFFQKKYIPRPIYVKNLF
jgi:tRNA threonylcarbamoyl adenosine modification protein YeaZ